MCRKMELNHLLTPHRRINSKWVKDLNVRPQTIIILKENEVSKILDISCRNFYRLYLHRQGKQTNKKIFLMGVHQTKKFLYSKGNHQQNKATTHRTGEHIFQYI